MHKRTMTYTDYDGNQRTEDFYFNLTKAELTEMELSTQGGLEKMINSIIAEQDGKRIVETFKNLILRSYGKKSPDGKRFIKSAEIATEFSQTEAYSDLFMLLATDSNAAQEFVNGIVPQIDQADKTDKPAQAQISALTEVK